MPYISAAYCLGQGNKPMIKLTEKALIREAGKKFGSDLNQAEVLGCLFVFCWCQDSVMWDTMSSCCLTCPTYPVSCCLFIYNSPVGSSCCTADQFISISSPPLITDRRKDELCHTLARVDPQSISTGLPVLRAVYVRKSGPADVTGQGPDSMLMGSSTSFSYSQ